MSRKPDFFLVGAAKSGTSSLYNYLVQHPSVFMSEPKEPHFFSEWRPPMEEVKGIGEYLGLFEGVPDDIRAGDASTSYLYSPSAARKIKDFRPNAKIIVVLRDPVSRAYSQYWNQVQEGVEPLSFEEALKAEPERIERDWWFGFHYFEAGRYADQVARYLDLFDRESVRIYLFEDLTWNAESVCHDAFSFLGVDFARAVSAKKIHNPGGAPRNLLAAKLLQAGILLFRFFQRQWKVRGSNGKPLPTGKLKHAKDWMLKKNSRPFPEMAARTRFDLKAAYKEDVIRLQALIGRDLGHWLR